MPHSDATRPKWVSFLLFLRRLTSTSFLIDAAEIFFTKDETSAKILLSHNSVLRQFFGFTLEQDTTFEEQV